MSAYHDRDTDAIRQAPLRPEQTRTNSTLEKGTSQFVEHASHRKDPVALHDAELMVGEGQEKLTFFVQLLSITAAISGFCFGFDTGVISASLVSIREDLGHPLTNVEKEWISSSTSVGALIGALIAGYLADKIGRKWVLGVGDVYFVVGAVIICASYSVPQIIVGRLILGLGVGTAAAVAPLYIGELAPTRFRGLLVTIQSIAITGGQFFSYCIGIPLTGEGGWRIQFAIGLVPALMQGAAIHFLPESPRYDLLHGHRDRALQTIRRCYSSMSEDYIAIKFAALEEVVAVSAEFQKKYSIGQRMKLILTKGQYRKPAITALGLGVFQQLCGFNSLMYYSATMFAQAGFDNPTATGLIVSGTNLFFTIVAMFILDRVGKRRILLCTYPGMVLGLALAAVAFNRMTLNTGGRLLDGVEYPAQWSNMMLGMMVVFIAFYATGSGNITWTVGELFPLEMRGLGSAILAGGIWAANIVISATFLTLMNKIGPMATFSLYAGICFLGLIFVYFCYPEPSGLSLEEIQIIYQYGFGVAKSREIRANHKLARQNKAQGTINEGGFATPTHDDKIHSTERIEPAR